MCWQDLVLTYLQMCADGEYDLLLAISRFLLPIEWVGLLLFIAFHCVSLPHGGFSLHLPAAKAFDAAAAGHPAAAVTQLPALRQRDEREGPGKGPGGDHDT